MSNLSKALDFGAKYYWYIFAGGSVASAGAISVTALVIMAGADQGVDIATFPHAGDGTGNDFSKLIEFQDEQEKAQAQESVAIAAAKLAKKLNPERMTSQPEFSPPPPARAVVEAEPKQNEVKPTRILTVEAVPVKPIYSNPAPITSITPLTTVKPKQTPASPTSKP